MRSPGRKEFKFYRLSDGKLYLGHGYHELYHDVHMLLVNTPEFREQCLEQWINEAKAKEEAQALKLALRRSSTYRNQKVRVRARARELEKAQAFYEAAQESGLLAIVEGKSK